MTKDYSITFHDDGEFVTLFIDGASIDAEVQRGATPEQAMEEAEENAFWCAYYNGQISKHACRCDD